MIPLKEMPDQNVYQAPVPPVQSPTVPGVVAAPPPPKKGLPKAVIFAAVGLIALVVLFLLIRAILSVLGTGGKAEITWWGLWEDAATVEPVISQYEKNNPNVKITYVAQSKEDYRERLTNSLAKGQGPDIFMFHNTWVPMFKSDLDYIPPSAMSAADFAQTFYPVATSDLTSGTGIVGIPLEFDGLALYINEDILSQAGKEAPTTWDDLRKLATELTRKDDQGTIIQAGVALGRTENVDHWPEILGLMMLQNGVNPTNPTGKLAEDALSFYTLFSTTDGVWDASLPPSTVAFSSGKLAMYFGPSWRAFEIRAKNPSLKFKTVPVPQLPKATPNEGNVTYASYWVQGVWARGKHKKEAWDFLKFLSSKDSLEKLYTEESKTRAFGEPYSRVDMASLLTSDPIVAAYINQAPNAQSWYLASRTFDGPTGINSQIDKYFEDAVNAVNSGTPATKALEPVAPGVTQVLQQYGLISK